MDEVIAVMTGIGLAAACGFRVFVPLFLVSLSLNTGVDMPMGIDHALNLLLGERMEWMGNTLVTTGLGVATAIEVGGFYLPWIDNLLDALATPSAIAAGTFLSGAFMPEALGDGALKWAVTLIAGGGTSAVVQLLTVFTRGASSATTGGLGNPLVATFELASSVVTTFLAVLIPILVIGIVLVLIFLARKVRRNRQLAIESTNGNGPDDTLGPADANP